jgi:ATP-dependent helicase/nuclease subunit B
MGEASAPALHTIPIGHAFADTLVAGILTQHGQDPLTLARGLILLPTNRAVQAIRDAFVRRAEPALLLPRLVAIGDPDLDDSVGGALETLETGIPPAIDPLTRQAMLARIIQRASGEDTLQAGEAMRLAQELGRTRDQLLIERVDPSRLRDAVAADDLAVHWKVSLEKLTAILDAWPLLLDAKAQIDLADRRNRLLDGLAVRWQATPPAGFTIAAGVASTAPAIAALLKTISRIPGGVVVFDGLDLAMPDAEWDVVRGSDETPGLEVHPQHHLACLLTAMGAGRAEVQPWPGCDKPTPRELLARLMFVPAQFTDQWEKRTDRRALSKGIAAVTLANPAEEALTIAIAMRHAIDTPARTAALITPDRALAERVSALLARWGIKADDSAGTALSVTKHGGLMLALADAAAQRFAPVPLMALLKHPLVRADDRDARLAWLDGARALDLALRGPPPAPGLAGIATYAAVVKSEAARDWWASVTPILSPLEDRAGDLAGGLDQLIAVATSLCGDALWAGPEGRSLSEQVAALRDGLASEPLDGGREALVQLLRDRFDATAIRPAAGGHPRLFIWGLIEARLQQADLVILGGLNEGVWPALPSPDPWLAPRIRRDLKLPGLERRIGLAAHDFASALGAPEVLLTRAARDDRSPTIASRFWLRLQTLTGGLKPPEPPYHQLARALDHGGAQPHRAPRPHPAPAIADRPTRISVTAVDTLTADPYAYYARNMLRLKRLDPINADPDARWRGIIIHDILDRWATDDDYRPDALVPRMERALDGPEFHPLTRALLLPRLTEAAEWIVAEVIKQAVDGRKPLVSEADGKIRYAGVQLDGRADRIDRMPDGTLAIIDYKLGEPPGPKQIKAGFASQLGLLGLMAEHGGFEGVEGEATGFEYWTLTRDAKSRKYGKVKTPFNGKGDNKIDPGGFIDQMAAQFEEVADRWLTGDAPFTPKRHPLYARSDYDHLMRLEEWEGRE